MKKLKISARGANGLEDLARAGPRVDSLDFRRQIAQTLRKYGTAPEVMTTGQG
jgi:hypothetical protein